MARRPSRTPCVRSHSKPRRRRARIEKISSALSWTSSSAEFHAVSTGAKAPQASHIKNCSSPTEATSANSARLRSAGVESFPVEVLVADERSRSRVGLWSNTTRSVARSCAQATMSCDAFSATARDWSTMRSATIGMTPLSQRMRTSPGEALNCRQITSVKQRTEGSAWTSARCARACCT
eukprot:scaffold121876_cov32-Tisochrysis_lutea.AAC.2